MKASKIPLCLFFVIISALTGCAMNKPQPINTLNNREYTKAQYEQSPNALPESSNVSFLLPDDLNPDAVVSADGFGESPALLKAYQRYLVTGHPENVKGDGIELLAYSPYKMPVLVCGTLQLCQITLQKGEGGLEIVNGDPTRWHITNGYMGNKEAGTGSYVVYIKPDEENIATNLTITTDLGRMYRFKLMSKVGAISPTVSFWYPQATLKRIVNSAKQHYNAKVQSNRNVISKGDSFKLSSLNLDYSFEGDKPAWLPKKVFDNGKKTFIKLPEIVDSLNLPVFFISINGEQSLANSHYKDHYIIFDGIFKTAMLVSGKGGTKIQVNLINNQYPR